MLYINIYKKVNDWHTCQCPFCHLKDTNVCTKFSCFTWKYKLEAHCNRQQDIPPIVTCIVFPKQWWGGHDSFGSLLSKCLSLAKAWSLRHVGHVKLAYMSERPWPSANSANNRHFNRSEPKLSWPPHHCLGDTMQVTLCGICCCLLQLAFNLYVQVKQLNFVHTLAFSKCQLGWWQASYQWPSYRCRYPSWSWFNTKWFKGLWFQHARQKSIFLSGRGHT